MMMLPEIVQVHYEIKGKGKGKGRARSLSHSCSPLPSVRTTMPTTCYIKLGKYMFRTLADFSAKTCKFILSKISQVKVRTRSNTKIYATAWKITKDII